MPKLAILNTHPIQYFAPLYRRIAQEPDIDLTVYFCSRQGADEYVDEGFGETIKWDRSLLEGYNHKFLKNWRRSEQVGGFLSLINPSIVSELRRHKYDALIVHGHNHLTILLAMFAAKVLGTAVMMRCDTHLGLHRSTFKRFLRKPLMSFLYNRVCEVCLPVGTLNREFYLFHGVDRNRMFTVPFAVDNEYFIATTQNDGNDNLRHKLGLAQGKPIILFASKLISRKRPMDLLLAFHQLQERGIDAVLLFVGSGELEQQLKDYVRKHNLPDVHFAGFRNQSELPGFYSIAEVFVFPSENEPWGLILNEVMCAGLPIVASREVGAVPDLVLHGQNGLTYEAGNSEELASCLSTLLEAPEKRLEMGRHSRTIIGKWNYDNCVIGVVQALAAIHPETDPIAKAESLEVF